MRIGIMSDSHGSKNYVAHVVKLAGDVDMWLHCGDIVDDAEFLKEICDVPVIFVAGNNDFMTRGVNNDEVFSVEGHRILLTHGHHYGVRYDTDELVEAAQELECDIAIYGHSHVADKRTRAGVLVLNPGSAALPRDSMKPSFMTMELEEGREPEVLLHRFKRP